MSEELVAKPRVAFVQLQKYNRDTGEFEGIMASSAPDQSNEILDWASSKPHFQRWFSGCHKRSNGASLGNVREMHQPIAAGKLTYIKFDDDKEQLYVRGRVFHPETKVKLEEAVLTGLSIGGDYGKKWPDPTKPGFVRYEAKPYEVSLVDNPCNPDAMLALTNAAGDATLVKFAGAAIAELEADDDPATDKLAKALPAETAFEYGDEPGQTPPGYRPGKLLGASDYAYVPDATQPRTWKYPLDSAVRVRTALARAATDKGIPESARRKAWSKIVRAATKFGLDVRSSKGASPMSPDEVVGDELRKQEVFKAQVREALFSKKGLAARVKKTRKALKKFIETFGEAGGLQKSYVSTISGVLNDLSGSISSLQSAFTPAVAAGMPSSPGNSQPGENVGGGTGSMVTTTPSSSGTGAMVPGVGMRAAAGGKNGKKGLSKKKLLALLEERDANLQKSLGETLVALLKPPTDAEVAAAERKETGERQPLRMVKEASDAGKVRTTAAAGAAAAAPEITEALIKALQEKAGDTNDPVGALKAKAELEKVSAGAIGLALKDGRGVEGGLVAAGFRK